MQSLNGQKSPQPEPSKPKRHNGSSLEPVERQEIVRLLSQGESIGSIARRTRHSINTVRAVRDQEWMEVDARKRRIAAQAERNATLAAEQLTEALEKRKLPLQTLIPTFGVSVDKMLALRGDAPLTLRHEHFHRLTDDDIVAFAIARSKQIQATVIESQPEPEPNPTLALDHKDKPVTSRTEKRATRKKPVG